MRVIIIIDLQCTTNKLTYVCESAGRSFAKLFGFIRQRYFHDAGYGPGRCLHLYGVWSQQLQGNTVIVLNLRARNTQSHNNIYIEFCVYNYFAPNQIAAENHLQPVEKIITQYSDRSSAVGPSFARSNVFYTRCRHGQRRKHT